MSATLTAEDVAAVLHVSPRTVCEKARLGLIRGSRPGQRWLFEQADVDDYVTAGQNRPAQASTRRRRRRAA